MGPEGELTRFQNSTVGFALPHSTQCLAASAFDLTHAWWGQEREACMDGGHRTATSSGPETLAEGPFSPNPTPSPALPKMQLAPGKRLRRRPC